MLQPQPLQLSHFVGAATKTRKPSNVNVTSSLVQHGNPTRGVLGLLHFCLTDVPANRPTCQVDVPPLPFNGGGERSSTRSSSHDSTLARRGSRGTRDQGPTGHKPKPTRAISHLSHDTDFHLLECRGLLRYPRNKVTAFTMPPSDFQRAPPGGAECSVAGVAAVAGVTASAPQPAGRSDAPSPQRRNDGQFNRVDAAASRLGRTLMPATSESWVEVASQPSSSSLSSIGDDIVTTGLRVGSNSYPSRRRRSQQQQQRPMPASFIVGHPASQRGATSSQEEYDETESEEDHVMTSSTEAIHPAANHLRQQAPLRGSAIDTDSDSDGDENATALGRPSNNTTVFRPQPNAFSHPPSHLAHRHSTGSAPSDHHPSHSRPPIPNRPHSRPHRGPPNFMSPSYQADNEAALRASLTTLLSCAAAARGLPKQQQDERRTGPAAGVVPSSQPMSLRLVPESELMAPDTAPATKTGPARTASNSSAPSCPSSISGRAAATAAAEKTKRAAATQSKPARATKKKRTSANTLLDDDAAAAGGETTPFFFSVSPTLLTWVVSAGVVVLVSVVGFGAGYVIGREVGRQEGGAGIASSLSGGSGGAGFAGANGSSSCGGELVRAGGGGGAGTLRRFRWGGVGKSVAA